MKNKNRGSSFNEFLQKEGWLKDAEREALERAAKKGLKKSLKDFKGQGNSGEVLRRLAIFSYLDRCVEGAQLCGAEKMEIVDALFLLKARMFLSLGLAHKDFCMENLNYALDVQGLWNNQNIPPSPELPI